ncbi:MAG: hypothetical protein IKY44_06270 [Clostridia bacterium]|nr:hypothetical protein [Clostridia bacterium]
MNKPSSKKATIATIIFCILLVAGIVLTMTVGPCTRSAKRRSVVITFAGALDASKLQSELETKLEGAVVLNERGKTTTTTKATTTTTKATTTTTKAATTTTATTTAATTTNGVAAAAETQTTTTAATTTAGTTAAGATTTTTTKATTTTVPANAFRSGTLVATISNCDEKTDEELVKILNEVFATDSFKNNKLTITELYEVEPMGGFSWTQIYACVILLIVVFVYSLIRYYSIGALASAVSAVVPAIVAVIGAVGASLICNIFADISISAVVAVATASAVIFSIIILENIKAGNNKDVCTVTGVASVIVVLLILAVIVSIIGWNGEVIFSCVQYAAAVVIAAIASLTYVRCMFSRFAPKASPQKKTSGKKPVIR